jgi:hypothetical protein
MRVSESVRGLRVHCQWLAAVEDLKAEGDGKPLEVHTPGMKTIEDVAKFLGVSPKNKMKTLALMKYTNDFNRFESPIVPFTLYKILKMLRWPDNGTPGAYTSGGHEMLDRVLALVLGGGSE